MRKLVLLFLAIILSTGAAHPDGNILGVLTVKTTGKAPFAVNAALLTDMLMQKAHEAGKFNVMTKENVGAMLKDAGKDISRCDEGECEVDFGRALNADYLLTSQLTFLGKTAYLTVRFCDVATWFLSKSVSRVGVC